MRIVVVLLAFILFSCGGSTTTIHMQLTRTTIEPAGKNCDNGGYRIEIGFDEDDDGFLDEDEVEQVKYVCNGRKGNDGEGTYFSVEVKDADETVCPGGGKTIVFSRGEFNEEHHVCNGEDKEGIPAAFYSEELSEGDSHCKESGFAYYMGHDTNSNGKLDESEREKAFFICRDPDGDFSRDAHQYMFVSEKLGDGNEICPTGGILLKGGYDKNYNRVLDPFEVFQFSYFCFGSAIASRLYTVTVSSKGRGIVIPALGTMVVEEGDSLSFKFLPLPYARLWKVVEDSEEKPFYNLNDSSFAYDLGPVEKDTTLKVVFSEPTRLKWGNGEIKALTDSDSFWFGGVTDTDLETGSPMNEKAFVFRFDRTGNSLSDVWYSDSLGWGSVRLLDFKVVKELDRLVLLFDKGMVLFDTDGRSKKFSFDDLTAGGECGILFENGMAFSDGRYPVGFLVCDRASKSVYVYSGQVSGYDRYVLQDNGKNLIPLDVARVYYNGENSDLTMLLFLASDGTRLKVGSSQDSGAISIDWGAGMILDTHDPYCPVGISCLPNEAQFASGKLVVPDVAYYLLSDEARFLGSNSLSELNLLDTVTEDSGYFALTMAGQDIYSFRSLDGVHYRLSVFDLIDRDGKHWYTKKVQDLDFAGLFGLFSFSVMLDCVFVDYDEVMVAGISEDKDGNSALWIYPLFVKGL